MDLMRTLSIKQIQEVKNDLALEEATRKKKDPGNETRKKKELPVSTIVGSNNVFPKLRVSFIHDGSKRR
jgi:hypothetical protein